VRAAHQVSSGIQYYGEQDSLQKCRPVSQRPGAWAGAIVYTDQGLVRKFISQKKWDKLREYIWWFDEHLQSGEPMGQKEFESKVGFLIHVVETYDFAKPYLQGFYLLLYAHCCGARDSQGYKVGDGSSKGEDSLTETNLDDLIDAAYWDAMTHNPSWDDDEPTLRHECKSPGPPGVVHPVPRLHRDSTHLNGSSLVSLRYKYLSNLLMAPLSVVYGRGDASGEGFGSLTRPLGMPPHATPLQGRILVF